MPGDQNLRRREGGADPVSRRGHPRGDGARVGRPLWTQEGLTEFAGCAVTPWSLHELLAALEQCWACGERGVRVGHHNLNSLVWSHSNPVVRAFYRGCRLCYIDGLPVVWIIRLAGLDTHGAKRVTLMHALPELLDWLACTGRSLFYLGGSPDAVASGRAWIAREWPQLRAELHHGFFRDDLKVLERINFFRPDVLLVGMGMPRQEIWIQTHSERLDAGAVLQAGCTLDYYTGLQPRPPVVFSRIGMGWLYRLVRNPRRLWRRYLIEPWALAKPFLRMRRALVAKPESGGGAIDN